MVGAKKEADGYRTIWQALPTGKVPNEWLEAAKKSRDARGAPVIDLRAEGEKFFAHHDEAGSKFKDWRRAYVVTWCGRDRPYGSSIVYEGRGTLPASTADKQLEDWKKARRLEESLWRSEAGRAAADGGYCVEFQVFIKEKGRAPNEHEARRLAEAQRNWERKHPLHVQTLRAAPVKQSKSWLQIGAAGTKVVAEMISEKFARERELRARWRKFHGLGQPQVQQRDQEVLF